MTTSTLKSNTARAKTLASRLQSVWQQVVARLTTKPELEVWYAPDSSGRYLWYAYDPTSDRSFSGAEAELRTWIESRYYAEQPDQLIFTAR